MITIIGGSTCKKIAYDLSVDLNIDYIDAKIELFADRELRIQLPSHLYEKNVIIVQSTSNPANDHLMELLLLIDAAKRAGSRRVISVIPYFGYSRQDRPSYEWGPISARLIASMLEAAGVDHIITLDLHSKQAEGFFKIGVQNIDTTGLFASFIERPSVVISPDIGGLIRARKLADLLQSDLAIIHKVRCEDFSCKMTLMGDVSNKDCVIIDDIADTGETLCKASTLLKESGAKSIQIVVTHAVLSKNAKQKFSASPVDKIITTNTILQEFDSSLFKVINIVPIISQSIKKLMCI